MIRLIFTLFLLLFSFSIWSQNEEDALRYSSINFGGSARYNSLAGAFGALGADLSVLSVNPAGMARFKNSEFSFTPQLYTQKTNTSFMGTNTLDSKEKFTFGNIGIVGVSKASEKSPNLWKSIQFGFAYNKLADFSERYSIKGVSDTSLSYVFAKNGNGIAPDQIGSVAPFDAGLAYYAYLIDPSDSLGTFYTTQMYQGDFSVSHTVEKSGSLGETDLSISGNYNDKIYIGGSIGFPKIRFDQTKHHTEITLDDSLDIESFIYSEYLSTRGNGYNFKAGIIFLPMKWLRLGAAFHTASIFTYMKDGWSNDIYSVFRGDSSFTSISPEGSYVYKLKTPGRFIGSLAVVIAKKGLISLDYEYVDYKDNSLRRNKYSGDSYNFESENNAIISNFRAATNLRIGAEYLVKGPWMVRAGFAHYQNGYNKTLTEKNSPLLTYAGGFGYRTKEFFIDFGYTLTKSTSDYFMYDPKLVDNTPLKKSVTKLMVTAGFKF